METQKITTYISIAFGAAFSFALFSIMFAFNEYSLSSVILALVSGILVGMGIKGTFLVLAEANAPKGKR